MPLLLAGGGDFGAGGAARFGAGFGCDAFEAGAVVDVFGGLVDALAPPPQPATASAARATAAAAVRKLMGVLRVIGCSFGLALGRAGPPRDP
jgi:hypothetical protein